jgi:hypothetical protein
MENRKIKNHDLLLDPPPGIFKLKYETKTNIMNGDSLVPPPRPIVIVNRKIRGPAPATSGTTGSPGGASSNGPEGRLW